jgi:phospholipase C
MSCAGLPSSQPTQPPPPPSKFQLTVSIPTANSGTVTSTPAGINCPSTCAVKFKQNTKVTLTASAANDYSFSGWGGGTCSGTNPCEVTLTANTSVSATFTKNPATITSLNHIIFLAQENRSFDEYFGYMRQYWANNGISDQQFDGLAQFTPASQCTTSNGVSSCAPPTNPPCSSSTGSCVPDPNGKAVPSFHILSECTEDMSPFWNESYVDWNDAFSFPGTVTWQGNGFVEAAANDARQLGSPINDTNGYRSMGYFTDQDLNYYYFMATNFATSDRWFSPLLSRTQVNRAYMLSSTSQGYAYPPGSNSNDQAPFSAVPIFEALQNAGITWRVYVDPTPCSGQSGSALNQCLVKNSYINMFSYESQILSDPNLYQNFVPNTQFATDVQNDATLAQVIYFDPPSDAGLDEHPSDNDSYTVNIQAGAGYIAQQMNALMASPSWKDSAAIFTYDEGGGFYDHVQPQPVPVPDSFASPIDLQPTDMCYGANATSGVCSFGLTGYRVPVIVISPYAKKNYVSHVVRDYTAWLSLVEERFGVKPLTARDGYWLTEKDPTTGLPGTMDEFFDFNNPPWMTPPSPPRQNMSGACNYDVPNPWGQ